MDWSHRVWWWRAVGGRCHRELAGIRLFGFSVGALPHHDWVNISREDKASFARDVGTVQGCDWGQTRGTPWTRVLSRGCGCDRGQTRHCARDRNRRRRCPMMPLATWTPTTRARCSAAPPPTSGAPKLPSLAFQANPAPNPPVPFAHHLSSL